MVRLLDISSDGGALAAASCMHGAPWGRLVFLQWTHFLHRGGGGGGGIIETTLHNNFASKKRGGGGLTMRGHNSE